MTFTFHTSNAPHKEAGFTFAELIVVLSIFAALAGVILFRFVDFNANIVRNTLAQDVALRIKEAQNDAITGRITTGLGGVNRPSYGVFFTTNTPDSFVYFFDDPGDSSPNELLGSLGNERFNLGQIPQTCNLSNECVDVIEITEQERIAGLCGYNESVASTGSANCPDGGDEVDELHISFTRPFPEASILDGGGNQYNRGEIILRSPGGQEVRITVWRTGQISVN